MYFLKYLEIEDFLSFEHVSLNFDKGFYLVTGFNSDTNDSNGSGKTNLFSAIVFALYGRTLSGLVGSKAVRWGKTHCKVKLILTNGNQDVEILRTDNSLKIKMEDSVLDSHRKKDLQFWIDRAFMPYDLFLVLNVFTQFSSFLLDMTDLEKKNLFKLLIDLSLIDKLYEKVRVYLSELESECTRLNTELVWNTSKMDSLVKEQNVLQEKISTFENQKQSEIRQIRDSIEKITREIQEFENKKESLSLTKEAKQEELNKLNEQLSKKVLEVSELKSSLKHYQDTFKLQQNISDSCYVCHQPIQKRQLNKLLKETSTIINKIETDLKLKEKELSSLTDRVTSEEGKFKNLNHNLNLIVIELSSLKTQYNNLISKLKETENRNNQFSDILISISGQLKDLEKTIKNLKDLLKETERKKDIGLYLKKVLSKEGVVSYIIENVFGELQNITNNLLTRISSESFQVQFKPFTKLATGELRENIEISIFYKNKEIPFKVLSGGQRQKINVAFCLALNKFSKMLNKNPFNFIILDEAIDLSLASRGQEDILDLLKSMKDIDQIFLVTHKDNLGTYFDKVIKVNRSSGITKLN